MITTLQNNEQHQHPNGRGWVANTAFVDNSVFVGEHAIVYGRARLSDNVRVEDTAQVSGNAELTGDVIVRGNRWVDGNFKASTGVYRENPKVQTKAQRLRPAEDGLDKG
jgi:carbonic anhydrase/acetyltransferase-like protein (isoleucine patch superfamily)